MPVKKQKFAVSYSVQDSSTYSGKVLIVSTEIKELGKFFIKACRAINSTLVDGVEEEEACKSLLGMGTGGWDMAVYSSILERVKVEGEIVRVIPRVI